MQELEKRIGLLRLMLADVEGKQAQLVQMENQYRSQLARIVEFVVYREGDVANALSLMSEVQGKLDEVSRTATHLGMIADKGGMELEVLLLTKRVAEAQSQLVVLEDRQRELSNRLSHLSGATPEEDAATSPEAYQMDDIRRISDEVEEVESEIARLQNLITEASERAARTIQR